MIALCPTGLYYAVAMKFMYQKTSKYFAQVPAGLEKPAAAELKELGVKDAGPDFRGVHFHCDQRTLYRVVYCARLVTHVLAPLLTFDCHSTNYLYKTARKIPWHELFGPDDTFAVFANVSNSRIRHSRYASLCLKDAIVDDFRDRTGRRPNVDPKQPERSISLHIHDNRATVSFDVAGRSLHKRGYRKASVDAPMQETLAAAIIRLSDWQGEAPLHDPMCGSGTLLCEALMHYCRIPSGFLAPDFAFRFLPDFDANAWEQEKKKADAQIRELPEGLIKGSDADSNAIAAARTNCATLPGGDEIRLSVKPFEKLPPLEGHVIVCNPPYGIRLGDQQQAGTLLKTFGDFLKQDCAGSTAYIYFGAPELVKKLGLKPAWRQPLKNGGLDGCLGKVELYAGTRDRRLQRKKDQRAKERDA